MEWIQRAAKDWLDGRTGHASTARTSVIGSWYFMSVEEADELDAPPIRTVAASHGRSVYYHPQTCSLSTIEDSKFAVIWLPMAINHISCVVLQASVIAANDIGVFISRRWQDFSDCVSASVGQQCALAQRAIGSTRLEAAWSLHLLTSPHKDGIS